MRLIPLSEVRSEYRLGLLLGRPGWLFGYGEAYGTANTEGSGYGLGYYVVDEGHPTFAEGYPWLDQRILGASHMRWHPAHGMGVGDPSNRDVEDPS